MKLLKKYRIYTYTSLCLVIAAGFLSNYLLFKYSNHKTADEVIQEYRTNIERYAREHGTLMPLLSVNSKLGHIEKLDRSCLPKNLDERIIDTLGYDHYQDETVVFRKMQFQVDTDDGAYIVKLMLPTIDNDVLIGTVAVSLLIFTLLFILFTRIIDHAFSRHIFRPFNNILNSIKDYDLEKRTAIHLAENNIDEFVDLSKILKEMTDKINERYYEMKEFLEYTSHELQTPLSVIQLKLESLNQKNFEDPEVIDSIASIQSALRKVIRFNRSVLFIAKIKNGQFSDVETISLKRLFDHSIQQYEEMLSIRKISVSMEGGGDFKTPLNRILGEHLVDNLFTNAIKHNCDEGSIWIESETDRLSISNTFKGSIPQGSLFEKYNHSSERKDSSGLGLAIVKTICIKNNLDIDYRIEKDIFIITLTKKGTQRLAASPRLS